ncbi:MAG: amidase [Desulfobacteraceae bacterium]|nr:amidase [Desulfobacteraceae bacterium]
MMKEYYKYDGLALAELVRDKEIHPLELLESAIDRAEKINPDLNAIIHTFYDRARKKASEILPKGTFAGVPFLIKDLMDNYRGEPMRMGSRGVFFHPQEHSELVKRYLDTGVIPFGKTNTPEFGLTITTEPKLSGPAHNPWKKGYSTGGSSGGSAAAVAARIVPIASANDGGGSIRFPAACCGVFGLKPSRGLTPMGPDFGEGWDGAAAGHIISVSVRDSAAMLDAVAGPETGSPYMISRDKGSYLEASMKDPKPLKIAFSKKPFVKARLHSEAVEGLEKTAKLLESLGHHVEEAEPSINIDRFWKDFLVVVCAHVAFITGQIKALYGKKEFKKLEVSTRNMAAMGHSLRASDLVEAKQGWHDIQLEMGKFLKSYDMFLTPTLISPPARHGVIPPSSAEEYIMEIGSVLPGSRFFLNNGLVKKFSYPTLSRIGFTALGNITGLPSASVPLHWTSDNLPLGMMLTGRMCDEKTIFSLCGQLERALPWGNKCPN